MADTEALIAGYIKVRDKKTELAKKHKEEMAPINAAMEKIENNLLGELNATNQESASTVSGTAFKVVKSNVKIQDWDVSLNYILENDLLHFLERRLAKSSVQEFVQSQGVNFPGTSIDSTTVVQIRRK